MISRSENRQQTTKMATGRMVVSDKTPFDPSPFFLAEFVMGRRVAHKTNRALVAQILFPKEFGEKKRQVDGVLSQIDPKAPFNRRRTESVTSLFGDDAVPLLPEVSESAAASYATFFPENAKRAAAWNESKDILLKGLFGTWGAAGLIGALSTKFLNPMGALLPAAFAGPICAATMREWYLYKNGGRDSKPIALDQEDFYELCLAEDSRRSRKEPRE